MRSILSEVFKFLFKKPFFRKKFFGIHKRIFAPLNLFKGVKKRIKLKNDISFELDISDWIQGNLYFLEEYENPELQFVEKSLKKGDVFIDIGANIGLYTLVASKLVGENGKVIAFEPLMQSYHSLKKNVSINSRKNIVLENLAIAEMNTQIDIFYNRKAANLGMASSYLNEYSDSHEANAVSIDLYLKKHPLTSIELIKIDIEGGEYSALVGMKDTLINYTPKLLLEIDEDILSFTPYSERDILDYLENLGYKKHFIDDNGDLTKTEKNKKRKNYAFIKKNCR